MAYDRSPSKNIYLNVAVNTLKKLRGLVPNTVPNLSSESGQLWGGSYPELGTQGLPQQGPT